MAVKPLTQPEYWATDAVYTTGPFIGQPQKVIPPGAFAAEGHRPGALFPTPAEYENSQQYNLTGLARWVFLGSSAGAADAHIVETDSTGRATLHGLTVTNTTTQTPVFATGNGVLAPVYRATNPNGGDGYVANLSGSTGSAFYSEILADSKGLEIEMDTVVAGVGVLVTADAATTAEALTITHDGVTNHAASITATGASCMALRLDAADDAALYCDGGVSGSAAILAVGKTDAAGVRGSGGPSGANGVEGSGTGTTSSGVYGLASMRGVSGQATDSVAGVGVYGVTANAAGLGGAAGVHGDGLNTAPGVMGSAVNGYGGLFTASGDRQTLFLSSRASDPTQTLTGGLWNRVSLGLSTFVANVARRVWHTSGGVAIGWNSDLAGATVSTIQDILQVDLTGANAPVAVGTIWILVTMEIGRNAVGAADAELQITDITEGPPVIIVDDAAVPGPPVPLYHDGPTYEKHVAFVVPYVLPAAGARSFTLSLGSTTAIDLQYRNAGMAVIGVF